MSNRRKEMWKLLYNLVGRLGADLNDVFATVEDILCREPSLIRPSLRELTNRFQDTFVLWIINKFVKGLGDGGSATDVHARNVALQQKILTSCLVNRALLFERLVTAYIAAINELAQGLQQLDELEVAGNAAASASCSALQIKAFASDDLCLREIDVEFGFQLIGVPLVEVDQRVCSLLHVLRHALSIGYAVFPQMFVQSLLCALSAVRECDFSTKLLGLRYCAAVFEKANNTCSPLVERNYQLTLSALALIWEQMPLWLYAGCVRLEELDSFIDVTTLLLQPPWRYNVELQCDQTLLELALTMLCSIVETLGAAQHKERAHKLRTLIDNLIDFMLQLQLQKGKEIILLKHSQQLLLLAEQHTQVLMLLAVAVGRLPYDIHTEHITLYFKDKLLEFMANAAALTTQLPQLLRALILAENEQCQRAQLNALHTQTPDEVVRQNYRNSVNLFTVPSDEQFVTQLDQAVLQFLARATALCPKELEANVAHMNVARLIVTSSSMRAMLCEERQHALISCISKAVISVLMERKAASHLHVLAKEALQVLLHTLVDEPQSTHNRLRKELDNIAKALFDAHPTAPTHFVDELRYEFCKRLDVLIAFGLIPLSKVICDFAVVASEDTTLLALLLKHSYCAGAAATCRVFMQLSPLAADRDAFQKFAVVCQHCSDECRSVAQVEEYMRAHESILLKCHISADTTKRAPVLPPVVRRKLCLLLFQQPAFAVIGKHLDMSQLTANDCLSVICSAKDISKLDFKILHTLVPQLVTKDAEFLMRMAQFILQQILESLQLTPTTAQLEQKQRQQQLKLLELITCCALSDVSEVWLFHLFKLTFFYLIHPQSQVVQEAVLCATELCVKHSLEPVRLWNWYKRDALNLVVQLAVYIYLQNGVRLTRSLRAFTKMLGFSCVQEFICRYYRLLTTMILPYCVKEPLCKGLLVCISKVTRKPISTLFIASFLRIYTHIYLTEEAEVGNKCIELIVRCTDFSLKKLMNTDVKQTVSEFLVYFNRNPQFVMKAFQCLLFNEVNTTQQRTVSRTSSALSNTTPSADFAKFIADRFLGIITYFETCLSEPMFEKPLKEEALYSLGQILRFVGPQHVTQFRFKIIAMLSFVLSLNDRHLQSICLKIWNIFLHIVNIQELGPSLSRIVASLQPLLLHSESEVNAIYEFVILNNDSLLGAHIPDLYFVENSERVAPAIRQCVARQTEILKSERSTLLEKIGFLYKQLMNESLQVRIYGLTYLRNLIAAQRLDMNHMVLSEMRVDPLVENMVDILVAGCRHEDPNLQLASAKCLGELGAIDPSYISTNCTIQQAGELPLSVHTDGFAIMALTELCRAYQFQKDTKYVDNFSLAIQETLAVCGVSPKEQKKMNVWEAVPARMRQIMEPLLTSCYTNSRRESSCAEHPIFNSSFCRSYGDWSFNWAARLIDCVQTEDTKHLLNSYKPSIKRDSNTLAIFFPYILLHALQDGSEAQQQQVYEEFEAVFNFSSNGLVEQPEYETSGLKEFTAAKYTAEVAVIGAERRSQTSNELQTDTLESIARNCTKLCSEQIDFLQRWVREWERNNSAGAKINSSDKNYKCVSDFLAKFDKLLIAKANFNTNEFARALMYLDAYIERNPEQRLQEQISFLIEIHGELMDADSVEGAVYMKKSNLSLAEEIMVNRIVDRPQEMMACYEQLMCSNEPVSQEHIKGMINCYLRMDTPETALLITDGLWQKLTDQYTDDYFKECKSELLWRLGRYDELEELLEDSVVRRKTTNWNIQCAEAFLLFRVETQQTEKESALKLDNFVEQLDVIRRNVLSTMRSCSGVKEKSYSNSYEEVVKLHLLNEMEKDKQLTNKVISQLTVNGETDDAACLLEVRDFFTDWDNRLSVLQPVVRVMEPILCFRRNLLIESKRLLQQRVATLAAEAPLLRDVTDAVDGEIGKLWIRSVQMYREAGSLQQAHMCIMKAEEYAPKTLFIEKVKLLWQKGDQTHSFKLLEENLERIEAKCERNLRTLNAVDRALYAELKYLQATFSAESMNICSELNLRYFREAIMGNRSSEKCYVQLAQYMEKIYDSFSEEQKNGDNGHKHLLEIMLNYAKSLKYGYENVYQSLPRLLSIWLDYTSQCVSICESATSNTALAVKSNVMQQLATKMNELINNCSNVLPTSIFYTAFSQLLSRICHPSAEVFNVLRTIVIKLIEHFPQQSLWMLLPIFKSSQTNRIKRCKLIFTDARLNKPQFQKLLNDFNMLAERLIELTNKEVTLDRSYELSGLVKQLPKLFEDPTFSNILLPFEKYMQATFPITSSTLSAVSSNMSTSSQESNASNSAAIAPANPFPYKQIYICGIKQEVTVLRSAAKPKKISIQCSDGKCYEVMVKPKDDLRKDFRLMEFNGLVKRYLHQDSQARHRRLRIRTYAAIPFNEECGLVEWLPKLNSFRAICNSIYRMRSHGLPDRILRQCALPKTESIEKKREIFLRTLLPNYPPVFHEWLRRRFCTPSSWYEARCAYVKTVAVMSMVGYILGLGDRHGENLLFDETNGDAVHVDFNCLFNQGELFAYPELVPFRLTHNMVFAMGPLGVEGMYRKCCEITLRVLKQQSKTLMSVLRPFVYDLVALNRSYNNNKSRPGAELTDPKAMLDVRRIEERLQGYVKRTLANSMPLSTEGQVSFLINEAMAIDNLAAMYIGWGSYI